MKIAFSTLGCPDWSWETILQTAAELGYDGISLRGVGAVLQDLTLLEFFGPTRLAATVADLARRGLEICCLDTSVSFHDAAQTEKMLETGKAHIDLAARLCAGRIRVFGNAVPEGATQADVAARIAAGLRELGRYAEAGGIDVLLETHGDFTRGEDVLPIMEQASHQRVGVVWDVHHSYRHGEAPATTYRLLKDHIRSTHFKDSCGDKQHHTYCLQGEGDIPARECLRLLKEGGYDGWIIYEWEKRWRPEISPPEEAFPHFIREIKRYLAEI